MSIEGSELDNEWFSRMASDEKTRSIFISSTIKVLTKEGFHGINIQWMYPTANDKDNFSKLVEVLYSYQDFGLIS